MALPVMAVLTEVGHFLGEQFGMDTAMTGMAGETVFGHRRMFVDIRAALVGVAAIAELLGIIRFDHMAGQAAVGRMAGLQLTLPSMIG